MLAFCSTIKLKIFELSNLSFFFGDDSDRGADFEHVFSLIKFGDIAFVLDLEWHGGLVGFYLCNDVAHIYFLARLD